MEEKIDGMSGNMKQLTEKDMDELIKQVKQTLSGIGAGVAHPPGLDDANGDSVVAYYKWFALDGIRKMCYSLERNQFYDLEKDAKDMVKGSQIAQRKIERICLRF